MQGVPAVGGGLGGLPKRTTTITTSTSSKAVLRGGLRYGSLFCYQDSEIQSIVVMTTNGPCSVQEFNSQTGNVSFLAYSLINILYPPTVTLTKCGDYRLMAFTVNNGTKEHYLISKTDNRMRSVLSPTTEAMPIYQNGFLYLSKTRLVSSYYVNDVIRMTLPNYLTNTFEASVIISVPFVSAQMTLLNGPPGYIYSVNVIGTNSVEIIRLDALTLQKVNSVTVPMMTSIVPTAGKNICYDPNSDTILTYSTTGIIQIKGDLSQSRNITTGLGSALFTTTSTISSLGVVCIRYSVDGIYFLIQDSSGFVKMLRLFQNTFNLEVYGGTRTSPVSIQLTSAFVVRPDDIFTPTLTATGMYYIPKIPGEYSYIDQLSGTYLNSVDSLNITLPAYSNLTATNTTTISALNTSTFPFFTSGTAYFPISIFLE